MVFSIHPQGVLLRVDDTSKGTLFGKSSAIEEM